MKSDLYLFLQRGKKGVGTLVLFILFAALLSPSLLLSQKTSLGNPDQNQYKPVLSKEKIQLRQQQQDEKLRLKDPAAYAEKEKLRKAAEDLGFDFSTASERCATVEYNEYLRERFSLSEVQEFEEWMEQKLIELGGYRPPRVIPVVVHVIHNGEAIGEGRNISEAQVLSQIKVLNDDFNRTPGSRGGSTDSQGGYQDRAAETNIRFVLANVDPFGNPTNGITRINGGLDAYGFADIEFGIKPATIWNPDYYFNIWVGSLDFTTAYAQFPITNLPGLEPEITGPLPAETDGIVVETLVFGSKDDDVNGDFFLASNPDFGYGHIATHEIGHSLGLRHQWGDDGGACGPDDYVDDTPAQADDNGFDCTAQETCGSIDMIENYMDYSADICYNLFTFGQKDRMDVVLQFSPRRASLLESKTHEGVPPPTLFAAGSRAASIGLENLSVNDVCDGAIEVVCGEVFAGSTSDATNTGVPDLCDITPSAPGEWYVLAGVDQIVNISTISDNTTFDTKLNVYSGSCGALTCVGGNDDSPNAPPFTYQSEYEFVASASETYYIYVNGFLGEFGDFDLTISCRDIPPPPDNDEPANAFAIDCGQSLDGTNIDAQLSPQSLYFNNPDVWYTFTSAEDQYITLSTCDGITDYDTRLELFDDQFNCIAFNDDGCGIFGGPSQLNAIVFAGVTYYIAVGGYNGDMGDFTLTMTCGDIPPGFTCDDPIPIDGGGTFFRGTTLDAIDAVQSGAPGFAPDAGGAITPQSPGKWHTITVAEDSYVRLNSCNPGTTYDSDIQVYVGGPCAPGGPNLIPIASDDDGVYDCFDGDLYSADVLFLAAAGVEYKVFVNGWFDTFFGAPSQGDYEIEVIYYPLDCQVTEISAENAANYNFVTTVCSDDYDPPLNNMPGSIRSFFTIHATPAFLFTNPADAVLKINGIETPFIFLVVEWDVLLIWVDYYAGPGIDVEFSFGGNCFRAEVDLLDAPEACSTTLGDFVWDDLDGDGVQEDGEPGLEGVTVSLYNDALGFVASTTTDADGHYTLYPPPGQSHVVFGKTAGKLYSPKDRTSDDLDSDANYSPHTGEGTTNPFNVVYPFYDLDLDAGLTDCPPLENVGCNDDVHITLDGECEALITADMILEGDYICYHDLVIDVIAPGDVSLGSLVPSDYFGQKLAVTVTDPQTGYHCWGYITLEDKDDPIIYCPESGVDRAAVYIQANALVDNLSADDDTFTPGVYSCWTAANTIAGEPSAPRYYNEIRFSVKEDGMYTFYMYSPEFDATGAIFQGDFDADYPCENIIALGESTFTSISTADDFLYGIPEWGVMADSDPTLRMALPLRADEEYVIVTTSAEPLAEGVFGWFAFRDGGLDSDGNILYEPNDTDTVDDDDPYEVYDGYVYFDLLCSDIENVLIDGEQCYFTDGDGNLLAGIDFDGDGVVEYTPDGLIEKLLATGLPYNGNLNRGGGVHDNCDFLKICVSDELIHEGGDCGRDYIKRSFYAVDKSGNRSETCYQIINFRKPTYADVIFPQISVPVECDEDFPVDAEGHPDPSLTGFPFIRSAFGHHDLNDSYCNIGAEYTNKVVIDVCDNTYKLTREWITIDWCFGPGQPELNNSPLINWIQIIKVGDFTAPEVEDPGDKKYVSTDPFACEGTLVIPEIDYSDNCSDDVTVTAVLYKENIIDVVDKYGRPTGETKAEYEHVGEYAPGASIGTIEKGHVYKVVYTATDACGNTSEPVDLLVESIDDTEPVAVCDDDLHISIGGEGIAKVTAEDVDEGSWDNCELKGVYVSRKLATDDLRDAYLAEVYDLSFDDLVESGLADKDNSSDAVIWVLDEDGDGEWDDENSDNPELFEVLRYKDDMWFTWWRDAVKFICDDMNTEVTIELLAVDSYHNTNRCWLDVLIEDKIAPYCEAPDDVEIYCDELPYGFDPEDADQLSDLFGDANGIDNCPGATADQNGLSVDWDCNWGVITRSFQATDVKGLTSLNSCKQTITVYPVHNYEIKFPRDADADCGVPTPDTIETVELACDLLSVNVVDERFEASGDACYKIKRTYKVINWCEYDGEAPAVVISRDADCDGETGEEDVYVLVRPDEDDRTYTITYVDRDNDEENDPSKSPCYDSDVYTVEGHYDNSIVNPYLISTGYWEYSQFIKVYDTTAPEITIGGDDVFCSLDPIDCEGDVTFPITVTDICAGPDVVVKAFINGEAVAVTGSYPDFTVSGRYELGDYELEIHAVDGCQNSELAIKTFRVADCKAPSPICINGLAIELMPTEAGTDADGDGDEDAGAMTIWASDFKVSGLEDCTGEVTLSINRVGETPNRDSDNLILTCDDPDTLAVEVYAWDNADNPTAVQPDGTMGGANYDHCLTYVLVQDNMFNNCGGGPGTIGVAGLIVNEENETVENVQVSLSGGMSDNVMTATNGGFSFEGLTPGNDYTITPQKDDDYLNGVSTFDLVLVTKHILGSRKLDSPYKMIAADANNSGSISALDLIYMRKLILSVNSNFPNNTSWRFVPASYEFPDRTNPWYESFPEILNYNDLQTAVASGDFVAIKVADVNGNAVANALLADQRTIAGVFNLNVADQEVIAGNEYRVNFTAGDLSIQGYQFTLNHEGLELIDLEYGEAKAENFGILTEDVITSSWNGEAANGEMFTMVFRAKVDGRLSELLSVNSRYTQAEAYDANSELLDVALNFGDQDERNLQDSFHLYQNVPNPFAGETMISFSLPQAAEATIVIQDVSGKTLKVIQGEYAKGYNQIRVNSNELPAIGLLYYTLETDDFTATKKMVVISE